MWDLAIEAISNEELDFSDSDIDEMHNDCKAVHNGYLDECNDCISAFVVNEERGVRGPQLNAQRHTPRQQTISMACSFLKQKRVAKREQHIRQSLQRLH